MSLIIPQLYLFFCLKYDAEIVFWEAKGREQQHQVEMIQQQINSSDAQLRISSEQVNSKFLI